MTSTKNENCRRRSFWYAGLTLAAAGMLGVLLFAPIPTALSCRLATVVCNFGHFVLFGAVALWLWTVSKRNVGLALCVSVAVAGICEAGQAFAGRSVSLPDFWRGVLGVFFTMVVIHACGGAHSFRQRICHAILAVALAAWPVAEVLPVLVDACGKRQASGAGYSSDSTNGLSASWLAVGLAPRWRWSTQNRRPSATQASPPTGGCINPVH